MAGEALKQARLGGVAVQVPQLDLRLGPGQRGRAHEGVGIALLVDELQGSVTRRGHSGPKRDAHRCAGRYMQAIAQSEYRIEDRAYGAGQSPAVHHRKR